MVEIALIGDVDVHSFREDKNYIIDVAFQQPDKARELPLAAAEPAHGPKPAAPAAAAPAIAAKPAAREAASDLREIVPPTSESIARRDEDGRQAEDAAGWRRGGAEIRTRSCAPVRTGKPPQPASRRSCAFREAGRKPAQAEAPQKMAGCDLPKPSPPQATSSPPQASRRATCKPRRGRHEARSRHRRCQGGGGARQRGPAPDLQLCRTDARGLIPPRRHGVAGVRFDGAARRRADPRQGRFDHRRGQPLVRWSKGRRSASASTGRRCTRSPPTNAPAARNGR